MKPLLAILVLVTVGAASVALLRLLNRRALRDAKEARAELLSRAMSRPDSDVPTFLAACGLDQSQWAAGSRLLEALGSVLQVPASKVAFDASMTALFSCSAGKSGRSQEPFAYELVDRVGKACNRDHLAAYLESLATVAVDDDSFATHLMGMTVPQVVKTFAPLVES